MIVAVISLPLCGCVRTKLIAEDAIVRAGQANQLTAYVVNKSLTLFTDGVPNIPVRFFVADREVGQANTDNQGCARVDLDSVDDAKSFVVRTSVGGREFEAAGSIFAWDPNRTAVAVDLDLTISNTNFINLLWGDGLSSRPCKGSVEALHTIANDCHILYYSARPRYLTRRTRNWLAQEGFPPGPVLLAESIRAVLWQRAAKNDLLGDLRRRWPNTLIGIGDWWVDIQCCLANGMMPVIINPWPLIYNENAVVVRHWRAVADLFETRRDILTDASQLAYAIERGKPLELRSSSSERPPEPSEKTETAIAETKVPEATPKVQAQARLAFRVSANINHRNTQRDSVRFLRLPPPRSRTAR